MACFAKSPLENLMPVLTCLQVQVVPSLRLCQW